MGSIAEGQEFFRSGAKPPFAARDGQCRLPTQDASFVCRVMNGGLCQNRLFAPREAVRQLRALVLS